MHIEDLEHRGYSDPSVYDGLNVRAVGWLGKRVPNKPKFGFLKRDSHFPSDLLDALHHYSETNFHDDGDLGLHECAICGKIESRGEFWIQCEEITYVLPMMVLHYIEDHEYTPPPEFTEALRKQWQIDRQPNLAKNQT